LSDIVYAVDGTLADLQHARATKGSKGKAHEEEAHGYGNRDEPVSQVASPGAKGGIKPAESEDSEGRAHEFVE
jgi:hypothetical protein